MAKKQHIAVWYDREGDFLEVMFEQKEGYFRETAHDQVMEKVDKDGCHSWLPRVESQPAHAATGR